MSGSTHLYRRLRLILGLTVIISLLTVLSSPSTFPALTAIDIRTTHRVAARQAQDPQFSPFKKPDLCHGWTSNVTSDDDPKGCMRAIKYRQVESLSRDLLREMTWSDKLRKRNVEAIERLQACLGGVNVTKEDCPDTTFTVIVGSWWWWDMALTDESESGETVWMRTITNVLSEQGYTLLSCSHYFYDRLIELHHALPDVISLIWAEDRIAVSCIADPRCVQGHTEAVDLPIEQRPGDIPLWKIFTLTYWGARPSTHGKQSNEWGNTPELGEFSYNPLGNAWTISPWDYPGHTYIPLSIERECTKATVVPRDQRKDQALVLAKLFNYFYAETFTEALDPRLWASFENTTGLRPIGTAVNLANRHFEAPEGLYNLGSLSRSDYDRKLAESKVLLGIGRPEISPSPYSALCQGVPVVIPYYGDSPTPPGWDLYHQELAQHGPAALLGEPYVYSYHYKDTEELFEKLERAKNTPIDRYIPSGMTFRRAQTATLDVVERDWEAEASAIIGMKQAGETTSARHTLALPDMIIERCFKKGNCVRLSADNKQVKTRTDAVPTSSHTL